MREVYEELGINLVNYAKFRDFECKEGDVHQNIKHVFWAKIEAVPDELKLGVGQKLTSIDLNERHKLKFANILGSIVDEFVKSGISIE